MLDARLLAKGTETMTTSTSTPTVRAVLAVAATAIALALAAPAAGQTVAPFDPPLPPPRLTPEDIAEAQAAAAAEAQAERRAAEAAQLALLDGLPLAPAGPSADAPVAGDPAASAAVLDAVAPAAGPTGLISPASGQAALAPASASPARTLRALPIGALRRSANGLTLNGRQGRLDLSLPIAEGTRLDDATVRLAWRSAAELAAERSRMWLYVNGEPVAELPMGAGEEMTAEIGLPVEMLSAGANRLTFVAHQEHVAGCEPEALARLWTQIDATNSYLVVEGAPGRAQATLAAFDDPAGPLGASSLPVRIAVAGAAEDPARLRIGALIAAGLALRGDERPVRIEPIELGAVGHGGASPGPIAASGGPVVTVGAVTVAAGTAEALAPVLGSALTEVNGPWLAMHEAAGADGGAILVVTGRTADEVALAAAALANPAWAMPDTPSVRIGNLPPVPRTGAWAAARPGSTVRFGDLDLAIRNAEGSAERTEVRFDLPPEVFVADNRKTRIRLSFAYGEGLSRDSLLNVVVNGAYVGAVPLDDADGAVVERLPIAFPAHHLRPGRNVIQFEPVTGAADALGCAWRPVDTARVDVFPESEIDLPEMAHAARLPDLALAATSGYPFVRPDGSVARITPASTDPDTVAALWTLVAQIAQVTGTPAVAGSVGVARPEVPGDVILVGRGDALAPEWLAGAPSEVRSVLSRTGGGARPAVPGAPAAPAPLAPPALDDGTAARAPTAPDGEGADRQVLASLLSGESLGALSNAILPSLLRAGQLVEDGFAAAQFWRDDAGVTRAGAPIHDAWLAAFPRPDGSGTVTVLAAEGGPQLRRAAHELVAPELWGSLDGDFASWRVGAGGLATARVADPLFVADDLTGWDQRLLFVNSVMAERPGLWFLLSLGMLIGFGAITSAALGLRDRRTGL